MERFGHASDWSDERPKLSERELLEWAASFSPRAEAELRRLEWAEAEAKAKARHDRELLEFVAAISEKPGRELRMLRQKEAEEREVRETEQRLAEAMAAQEAWDAAKHRRLGGPPNAGWWTSTGGTASGANTASGYIPSIRLRHSHNIRPPSNRWPASDGTESSPETGSIRTLVDDPDRSPLKVVTTGNPSGSGGDRSKSVAPARTGVALVPVVTKQQLPADTRGV